MKTFCAVAKVTHVGEGLPYSDSKAKPPQEPLELIDGGVAANDPAFQVIRGFEKSVLFVFVGVHTPFSYDCRPLTPA
jgi:hypothetical protein